MRFWILPLFIITPALADEPKPSQPDPYALDEVTAKAAEQVGMLQQALGQAQLQIIELKRKATICPPSGKDTPK